MYRGQGCLAPGRALDARTRHFGESLFAAQHIGSPASLLDFGSGAGFPGIPICLLRPEIAVTLAESQHKKVSFLREAIRTLGLRAEVWPRRVEQLPEGRLFDCVTLRAVDNMRQATLSAERYALESIVALTTSASPETCLCLPRFPSVMFHPIPQSATRVIAVISGRVSFHVEQSS